MLYITQLVQDTGTNAYGIKKHPLKNKGFFSMNKILAIPPGDLLRSVSDYVDAVCRHDADDSSPMNYAMRNFR